MTEQGTVSKIKDGVATVRLKRNARCDACRVCKTSRDGRYVLLEVQNTLAANEGDRVEVQICKGSARSMLLATCGVYAIPVVLTAAFGALGVVLNKTAHIAAVVSAFAVGMLSAVLLDVLVLRKMRRHKMQSLSDGKDCDKTQINQNNTKQQ